MQDQEKELSPQTSERGPVSLSGRCVGVPFRGECLEVVADDDRVLTVFIEAVSVKLHVGCVEGTEAAAYYRMGSAFAGLDQLDGVKVAGGLAAGNVWGVGFAIPLAAALRTLRRVLQKRPKQLKPSGSIC